MAGAIEAILVLPPGDGAAQVGAAVPHGQHSPVQPGDVEASLLYVADGPDGELLDPTGLDLATEAARFKDRFKELEHDPQRLPHKDQ